MSRLPDFLVIGAYKCGTTTLHHALRQHPQLFVPDRKEPNFYAFGGMAADAHPAAAASVRDRRTYEALFAPAPADAVVGEVSPAYLANDWACERIAAELPDVRLVAILRHPVERAYSDFLMYVRDGAEPHTDFGRALDEQDDRRRRGLATGHYLTTGFYGEQLEPYVATFGAERLHVLLVEELAADQTAALRGICRFLDVDPEFEPAREDALNVSGVPTSPVVRTALRVRRHVGPALKPLVPTAAKHAADRLLQRRLARPPMPPEQRARLLELYRPDVERLERLLERDLSAWKS